MSPMHQDIKRKTGIRMFASQENLVGLTIHHVDTEYLEQRIGFRGRHLRELLHLFRCNRYPRRMKGAQDAFAADQRSPVVIGANGRYRPHQQQCDNRECIGQPWLD